MRQLSSRLFLLLVLLLGASASAPLQAQTGTAVNLDGVNDQVVIDVYGKPFNAYTFQVRCQFTGSTASRNVIVYSYGSPTNSWSHQIRTDASGHFVHYVYDGTLRTQTGTSIAVPGQWYTLSISATSNGLMHLYVDGVEDTAPITVGMLWMGGSSIHVGCVAGNGSGYVQAFEGNIDEVRIWNTDIGSAAIAQFNSCTVNGPQPSLIRLYKFNANIGGGNNNNNLSSDYTVYDESGRNSNASLSGFALTGPTSNWVSPAGALGSSSCGNFKQPDLQVKGNNLSIENGNLGSYYQDSTRFGDVIQNTPAKRRYVIRNNGYEVLNVTGITFSGPSALAYSVVTAPAAAIAAGDSSIFEVQFLSATIGSQQEATLKISSDDADEGIFTYTLSANTVAAPTPLPVVLAGFEVRRAGTSVDIEWRSVTETALAAYELERSSDGKTFTAIHRQPAAGGSAETRYQTADAAAPAGTLYYRLKLVDADGSSSYSPTRLLRAETVAASASAAFYPNPAQDKASIRFEAAREGLVLLKVYNQGGALVQQLPFTAAAGVNTMPYERGELKTGLYYFEITNTAARGRFELR